jgi:hypothetical protein
MFFPVSAYPALKQIFDLLNKEDNHQITLKQTAAAGSN